MIRGKTESGFEFELDDQVLDDYELLEALISADRGDSIRIFDAVDRLLDETHKEKLKRHLRDKHGRVPATRMVAETMEIFKVCQELKN